MVPPIYIFVTAPKDRRCPIHPQDGSDAGGLLYVEHGRVTRVKYSQDVRRAISRGDLILSKRDGGSAKSLEEAAAPKALETGAHVTLDAKTTEGGGGR